MKNHLFTVIAVLLVLLAAGVATVNPSMALYLIGGVLLFAFGLLIWRIKNR